jgi:sporulation protein YqfC
MSTKRKGRVRRRLEQVMELPGGTLYPALRMELSGNHTAVVEGCLRVLQYETCRIRLQTVQGDVSLEGDCLSLEQLEAGCAIVKGKFCTIGFSEL